MEEKRLIFHVDVNSAYLSWTAMDMLQKGAKVDLRKFPSVVGGDPKTRHGIVLAKSIPAKKYNIQTGESIYSALQKCPSLVIVPGSYELYGKCSNAMIDILKEYTPAVQRYSVDECFLDFSNMENCYADSIELANTIRERIKNELGFTVNIGVSSNKLLAKVASDLKKPDRVHTLFPEEIKDKMWRLPIEDLFMVGRATLPKLKRLNINTIGDLANYDEDKLRYFLKSHGTLIWNYANGIEDSAVRYDTHIPMKGIGNSTTIPFDVEDRHTAYKVLLSLCETVASRLRNSENGCQVIAISIRNSSLISYSKQKKIVTPTNITKDIFAICCKLFDELWKGEPIRHLGVSVTELSSVSQIQLSIFDEKNYEKKLAIDMTIDSIRKKYGPKAIVKSTFLHSGIKALSGGVGEEDYPVMSSIL